jgi:hypothetical protein
VLHNLVAVISGPTGAATLSLLSTVPHHPALAEAFRSGPLGVWKQAFGEVFARAEARGELPPGVGCSVIGETTTGLLVQRWLLTGRPVDQAYADEVLDTVVLPLLRGAGWPKG